jgi:hypothetical protein
MLRKRLFELEQGMGKLSNLKGVKLNYALVKNKRLIESEISILKEIMVDQPYSDFTNKRIAINVKYAKKNENGNPVIENNHYIIDEENLEVHNTEIAELLEQNKEVIDNFKKKEKEYYDLLETELDAEFHVIDIEEVPADITYEQMEILADFIADFAEE